MNKHIAGVSRVVLAIAGFAVLAGAAVPASALESEEAKSDSVKQSLELADSSSLLMAQESDDDDEDDDDDNETEVRVEEESIELSGAQRRTVLETIAGEAGVGVNELRIVEARRATWSDSCLGLGGINESCLRTQIPGYVVVVARGESNYIYRVNESGDVVVLDEEATRTATIRTVTTVEERTTRTTETQTGTSGSVAVREGEFSQSVQTAVFQSIAQRYQVDASSLRVVEVRRRVWSNGCLGLNLSGRSCTQATVPGYLVAVRSGEQIYVYRTDLTGSVVYLDEAATQLRTAQLRVRNTRVSFRDVPSNYWAAEFISQLAALDIIDGYPDGLYRPDRLVTRAEFSAIIRRAFEETEVREAINFLDVDRSYWAYTAIQETYQMGFLSGAAGNLFRPVASLTRGDVLFALARGLDFSTASSAETLLANYTDVTISSEETRLLLAALTEQGVIVNYPNVRTLTLERTVTRAEVAVIVYQTLVSLGRVEAIDSPYIVDGTDVIDIDEDDIEVDDDDDEDDIEVDGDDDDDDDLEGNRRQNCNQGIGNGAEGCDPGNSSPRGGSNDEGGRTPGQRP